ncbi:glycoside hydrolase family 2 protein [Alicyclobacillus sp. ALC3]|uniref:glycoside hydrolase family 2 protein n=1 Tax=Alicyclobacillus sp. ALC3 TaxID=2796143 RepID=UPI00237941EF|nr:glycoside hydrolase family 2 TIM barrel-domain containing protein [Alicyclobacillus sp. ALC3]WDL96101.1 beta-galactosidase [Alicyclobacillus sp. ALC3]
MKQVLGGMWHYEPLEHTVIKETETIHIFEGLPPTGTMELPRSWQLAGVEDFNGVVRFSRSFRADLPPGERIFLRFAGVDYSANVRLNGVHLGTHEGYFQAFEFEVTDVIGPENELEVKVSCPREDENSLWPNKKILVKGVFNHHDARPGGWHPQTGQSKATGGIWGAITLESRPVSFIKSVKVQTVLLEEDEALVEAQVMIDSSSRVTVQLSCEIAGESHDEMVSINVGITSHSLVIRVRNPQLWWTWDLGTPNLYDVRVSIHPLYGHEASYSGELVLNRGNTQALNKGKNGSVCTHEVVVQVGLRSVHYDKATGTWFLNGQRIFLRGTNVIPTQWLSDYTDGVIARDMELLRVAHINAVRVHAHVNRKEFYEACDSAGIFVWQDFPLQWSYLERNDVLSSAVSQIRDMVEQLYNHPSIFTWCCHNEPSSNAQSMDALLVQVVRGLDSTRHVHQQSDFKEHPYWGWYLDDYTVFRDAPMGPLVTEFGAQAFPNRRVMDSITTDISDWARLSYHNFQWDETVNIAGIKLDGTMDEVIAASQSYQAELLKFVVENYRRHRYKRVGALFQFMFMDCWPSITWSVVDVNREPKQGYEALRAAYQPVLPILVIPRKRWLPGRTLSIQMWIVNDLPQQFVNVHITAKLTFIRSRQTEESSDKVENVTSTVIDVLGLDALAVNIPQDACMEMEPVKYQIPSSVLPGEYRLGVVLHQEFGGELSTNSYIIVISEPAPNFYDGPTEALNG